jgi:hypothetical protein
MHNDLTHLVGEGGVLCGAGNSRITTTDSAVSCPACRALLAASTLARQLERQNRRRIAVALARIKVGV